MAWTKRRLLGRGAFGKVYLAQSTELLAQSGSSRLVPYVALKTAPIQDASSLRREKRAYATIRTSRYILKCFGSSLGRDENNRPEYCLVLEYAPRGTLLSHLRGRRISQWKASAYAEMMLKGLFRVHQSGLVHCDLKPDNVLLFSSSDQDDDVTLKLGDFGVSKRQGVMSSHLRGTLRYSSPESVGRAEHEPPADIWSLGVIVHLMLTGVGLWDTFLHFDPHSLSSWIAGYDERFLMLPDYLSSDAVHFVRTCLRRDPRRRWTAANLLQHRFITNRFCHP